MAAAIAAVNDGGTVKLAANSTVAETLTLDKNVTIQGNGASITAPMAINDAAVTLDGVKLVASGASASDATAAVKVNGTKDFTLTNSTISGKSRNALLVHTSGNITISGNTFNAGSGNIYNAIEFGISNAPAVDSATITGNTFTGTLGNNAISMYNFQDGAIVNIADNVFSDISPNNNPVRLSNPKNVNATFNITNNTYSFNSETPTQYTAFMLLQDYAKEGEKQDFSKFTVNFNNLKRGTTKLTAQGEGLDRVYYVYDDQDGILDAGVNDPVVNFA